MSIAARIPLHALAVAMVAAVAGARPAGAQQTLGPSRTLMSGPVFETWSFGDGLYQPTVGGGDSVALKSARQWSFPVAAQVPLGRRMSFDVSGAYASGEVTLRDRDRQLDVDRFSVSGLTDLRLRLTSRFAGDNVIVTLGANVPTGATELTDEELSALRVIAAPALGFQVPVLGIGPGGTAGVVFARQVGPMAWALGLSYEYRGGYTPVSIAGGLSAPDFNPSDAVHLSLATDGLVGENSMRLSLSADAFTSDRLRTPGPTEVSNSTRLGPIFGAEWEFRFANTRFRELALFAVDRYRTAYQRDGETVSGSSGNYLDAGLRSVYPLGRATGLLTALTVRHHTGLSSDTYLASAAAALGGVTLGLQRETGRGYLLQSFVRGQIGQLKTGDNSAGATGMAAGVSFGRAF